MLQSFNRLFRYPWLRIAILVGGLLWVFLLGGCSRSGKTNATEKNKQIKIAVEFVDHAASADIARAKGWYRAAGLNVDAFDNYITGMALAAALTRGDIDAAYICMIPAISAFSNGGVRIKVVCGTHKYGYGLVVNPKKVKNVYDLLKDDVRVACPREGSPPDALMNKLIEKYNLDGKKLRQKVLRMPPPKILLALEMGQIDAGFCCEQFPTMGESMGFKEIVRAEDLWPNMQGSVLVVKDKLIDEHPDVVRKLVEVTERGIDFVNKHPDEASVIVARALSVAGKKVLPLKVGKIAAKLRISPSVIKKSLTTKMIDTPAVDAASVQEEIDYMYKLGYIKKDFNAKEILDLSFLK